MAKRVGEWWFAHPGEVPQVVGEHRVATRHRGRRDERGVHADRLALASELHQESGVSARDPQVKVLAPVALGRRLLTWWLGRGRV